VLSAEGETVGVEVMEAEALAVTPALSLACSVGLGDADVVTVPVALGVGDGVAPARAAVSVGARDGVERPLLLLLRVPRLLKEALKDAVPWEETEGVKVGALPVAAEKGEGVLSQTPLEGEVVRVAQGEDVGIFTVAVGVPPLVPLGGPALREMSAVGLGDLTAEAVALALALRFDPDGEVLAVPVARALKVGRSWEGVKTALSEALRGDGVFPRPSAGGEAVGEAVGAWGEGVAQGVAVRVPPLRVGPPTVALGEAEGERLGLLERTALREKEGEGEGEGVERAPLRV
jgi:hypothetical protein